MGPSNLLSWRDWFNYFYSGQFFHEVKTALFGTIGSVVGWAVTIGVGVAAYFAFKKRWLGSIGKYVFWIPLLVIAVVRVAHSLFKMIFPGSAPSVEV